MKRWKRGAAMLLCLCMMAVLLVGCGRGRSGESTASVVMTGSVSTVDPAYAATPAERTLVLHLFDNLYRWTAEGAVPAAAHAYDCTDNEDGTQTYTFHLRRDGKWSDGSDVTAADFVYAWRRLVSPETDSPEAEILSMVAGYEDAHAGDPEALGVYAEDEHTFVVTLSTMCPYFVDAVCTAAATMPVQQKAVGRRRGLERQPDVVRGQRAVPPHRRLSDSLFATLVKQEDHYNARQVRADRIEIRFKSAAEAADDAGTADAVIGAAGEDGTYGGSSTVGVLLINQMATNMDRTELRQAMRSGHRPGCGGRRSGRGLCRRGGAGASRHTHRRGRGVPGGQRRGDRLRGGYLHGPVQSGAGADDAGGPAAAGGADKPGDGDAAVPEYAGADGTGPAAAEGVAGKTGTERDPAGVRMRRRISSCSAAARSPWP